MTQSTSSMQSNPPTETWVDRYRYLWLLALSVPLIPFTCYGLVHLTGLDIFWWFGPLFLYGVFPFLEWAVGKNGENPPEAFIDQLQDDRYYRWCTYLFIPLQYVALIFSCYVVASHDFGLLSLLGFAVSVGCVNGIAIANAHELGHRREALERRLSLFALAPSLYGHFIVEHNRGHHVRVATPDDPASARLGESFYQFLPRTLIGSFKSALHLESLRLQRRGLPFFSVKNIILQGWFISGVLFLSLCLVFGIGVLPFLLIQAAYGASLLEVVNYLEHYGLLREKLHNGRYERCRAEHSWNSNVLMSNLLLYQLQRHSDHHENPARRYQSLRHVDDAPQLPNGYATMVPLAYIPFVWHKLMDKRVVAHYDGNVARANIHPPAREKILKTWGAASSS